MNTATIEMDAKTVIECLQLVVAIIGGILVAWIWNERKHRLEQYRYLDQAYTDLLRRCFENPQFCDPTRTNDYVNSYKNDDATRYHYFAMTVHTIMETIFDLSKGNIPYEWVRIFEYHTSIHSAWLKNNQDAQEPEYVKRVLRGPASKPES
jgi:hypothetical protein